MPIPCANCNRSITPRKSGRRQRFCSQECHNEWWREELRRQRAQAAQEREPQVQLEELL